MKYIHIVLLTLSASILTAPSATAQGGPPAPPPSGGPSIPAPSDEIIDAPTDRVTLPADEPATNLPVRSTRTVIPNMATPQSQAPRLQSFKFEGADLDTVMTMYCEWTGKIYLKNDSVTASISLKADKLTIPECINVVESILAMNNIAIVPYGKKFIKVVQANSADLTGEGLKINIDPDTEFTGRDTLVTQIIPLRNVQIPEVQNAIQHIMHSYGKIQTLEGSNSLLITDTESNILRIRELVDFVDQASARIEPRIYEIVYAEASEIAAKLNEIITMAQTDQKTGSAARGTTSRATAGVIRARATTLRSRTAAATPTRATISSTEAGSRMIIQGTVKVMADERTNLILIFSQEENFDFFDNIIKVLDVEVEPAITFEVVNLEYADAVDLSGTLNDLVGAAQGNRSTSSGSSSAPGSSSSRSRTTSSSRSATSRNAPTAQVTPNAGPLGALSGAASVDNLSKLSENTKILADERSNSILLMGRKSDIAAIKNVIASLDVMLEQVIIEAAIFEIGLDDELRHGIEWLYRALGDDRIGAWDGASLVTNAIENVASSALTYYQNLAGIDSQIFINLSKTDSDSRLISTPVIMTTDNTEATLSIGEQRPVVTSTDSFANSSGTQRSNYEYKDIGIQLTVTPRINPQRFVVMEISQKADNLGPFVTIDGNQVPVIQNREFEASIAVPDGGTVVLGGLMRTDTDDTVSKIPILGDIPLLGRYLFSSVIKTENTTELIVLMTPYVMTNLDEMTGQTERLYEGTSIEQKDWARDNWSGSKLRQIPDPEDFEEGQWVYDEPAASTDQDTTNAEINSPAPASTRQVTADEEVEQLLNSIGQ